MEHLPDREKNSKNSSEEQCNESSEESRALMELLAHCPRKIVSEMIFNLAVNPDKLKAQLISRELLHNLQKNIDAASRQRKRAKSKNKSVVPSALGSSTQTFLTGNQQHKLQVVGWFDQHYPALLRHIPDPPLVLYYQGRRIWEEMTPWVALVGSRQCTRQAAQLTADLACQFALHGVSVASGLAYGIDAQAHRGVVAAGAQDCGGRTLAVLGSGHGNLYPAAHHNLAQQIISCGGCLLSEYPPEQGARKHQFLERNRIISGLCQATIVVEAAQRSGALATARFALEQGREVWAVPGVITNPKSRGCLNLINDGANIFLDADSFLHTLTGVKRKPTDAHNRALTELELLVLTHISMGVCTLEELTQEIRNNSIEGRSLHAGEIQSVLGQLELEGIVLSEGSGYIAARPRQEL